MKTFHGGFAFLLAIIIFCCLPSKVAAFGGTTHQRITDEATHQLSISLPKSAIMAGCTDPDEIENDGGTFVGHFYDHKNDTYYGNNAFARMEFHYAKAVLAYTHGNRWDAGLELGRALHYVQDMCCPVHSWGFSFNLVHLGIHFAYEKKVDDVTSYVFRQYRPSSAVIEGSRSLRMNAVHRVIRAYNTRRAFWLREITGKEDTLRSKIQWLGTLGGLNPYTIASHSAIVLKRFDPSFEMDEPLKATCDIMYQFCKETGAPYRFNESHGAVRC